MERGCGKNFSGHAARLSRGFVKVAKINQKTLDDYFSGGVGNSPNMPQKFSDLAGRVHCYGMNDIKPLT